MYESFNSFRHMLRASVQDQLRTTLSPQEIQGLLRFTRNDVTGKFVLQRSPNDIRKSEIWTDKYQVL
jgi:hypothetical protein